MSQRYGLNKNVAQRCGLDRAGHDLRARGICRELIEQSILAPAPDNMQLLELAPEKRLKIMERSSVEKRQAFKHATNCGARRLRLELICLPAIGSDPLRHFTRGDESRIVRVNQRDER